MSGVDRLAVVSKVLLDQRFLELKRENERLKLSLFWVDHSINSLKKLMARANEWSRSLRCRCRSCRTRSCIHNKRCTHSILDGYDDEVEDKDCRFRPWFEEQVREHGLSVERSGEAFTGGFDRESYHRPNVDAHFLLVESEYAWAYNCWNNWVYGAKLWKAQTTQDAELLKLTALFKTLDAIEDPDWSIQDTHESDSDS
jgi:hypothetical protein